jgi:hypothetical protein
VFDAARIEFRRLLLIYFVENAYSLVIALLIYFLDV